MNYRNRLHGRIGSPLEKQINFAFQFSLLCSYDKVNHFREDLLNLIRAPVLTLVRPVMTQWSAANRYPQNYKQKSLDKKNEKCIIILQISRKK